MSYSRSRHWSLVGIRPRLAQASCTAAVHSRQLMELGEPTLTGPLLDLLKKGTLVKVEGFFEVNQYVGKDEKEHQTIVWKATAIEKKETQEA